MHKKDKWRKQKVEDLDPISFEVTQKNGTEPAFQNQYWNHFQPGIYVNKISGEPLFVSTDKFKSGCGWPSFSKPISSDSVLHQRDLSHGMNRIEVRSQKANSHLGHVFDDGPKALGGKRYCINSAALRFIPKEKMIEEGYEEYLKFVQ